MAINFHINHAGTSMFLNGSTREEEGAALLNTYLKRYRGNELAFKQAVENELISRLVKRGFTLHQAESLVGNFIGYSGYIYNISEMEEDILEGARGYYE